MPPGRSWSGFVRCGETIRIVDLVGEQAVDFLVYSAADKAERYDAQLTLLMCGGTTITRGTQLLSNRGYELMTVMSDTLGAHDTLVGCCSAEANTVRFGEQAAHLHSCRDNFLIELAKHGMSKRDIVPNLNFFMPVPVEEDGRLAIIAGSAETRPLRRSRSRILTYCACSRTARRLTIRATDSTQRRLRSRFQAQRAADQTSLRRLPLREAAAMPLAVAARSD